MNRRPISSAIATGLLVVAAVASPAWAEADPEANPTKKTTSRVAQPDAARNDLFTRLDADRDGRLTADELPPAKRKLFKRLLRTADDDRDGQLTKAEFTAGLRPTLPPRPLEAKQPSEFPGADQLKKLIAELDANGDGRIVPKEVPEKHQPLFKQALSRADQDKDGKLSRQEISRSGRQLLQLAVRNERGPRTQNPRRRGQNLFRRFDADQDGKVTLDEIPKPRREALQKVFKEADRDSDQALNLREFLAALARIDRTISNGTRNNTDQPKDGPKRAKKTDKREKPKQGE